MFVLCSLPSHAAANRRMATLHRVSELKHLIPPFENRLQWTALDYHTFLLYSVGTLICDEVLVNDEPFRQMIIHLANVVYLLHMGDPPNDVEETLKSEMIAFCKLYIQIYGEKCCTWKFHNFQHMLEIYRRHGPAFLWDAFNLEGMVGFMKKVITARRNQLNQGATIFLLQYHSQAFKSAHLSNVRVQEYLRKMGLSSSFFAGMKAVALTYGKLKDVSVNDMEKIYHFIGSQNTVPREDILLKRVLKLKRFNQVITSAGFPHKGQVNDSFVMVNSKFCGQVQEIVELRRAEEYLLIVQLYRKTIVRSNVGIPMEFPMNQFPVVETADCEVLLLTPDVFLQKILISSITGESGGAVRLFAPRPNEFFES